MGYYLIFGVLCTIVCGSAYAYLNEHTHWPTYLTWMASINVTAGGMYTLDQILASLKIKVRMPEFYGLLLPVLGGFAGGWLAMLILRYKTQHREFWCVQWFGLVIHFGLMAYWFLRRA